MSKPVINYPQYAEALVDISVDADLTAEIDISDYDLVGLFTPSNFDGTDIVFHASQTSGGTFVPVAASNAGTTAYTIVTAASKYTPINPDIFTGVRYLKVETTTDQATNNTTITLALRKKI